MNRKATNIYAQLVSLRFYCRFYFKGSCRKGKWVIKMSKLICSCSTTAQQKLHGRHNVMSAKSCNTKIFTELDNRFLQYLLVFSYLLFPNFYTYPFYVVTCNNKFQMTMFNAGCL